MNGKITISRVTSNRNDDFIKFEFTDKLSGIHFLQAKMTLEDFAKALTGLGYVNCEFELYPANVGKVAEHKTEIIPLNGYESNQAEKEAALKPFEVDGWIAYRPDLTNGHRYTKNGITVSFTRFVETE